MIFPFWQLATIHYDSAPRLQKSCFANTNLSMYLKLCIWIVNFVYHLNVCKIYMLVHNIQMYMLTGKLVNDQYAFWQCSCDSTLWTIYKLKFDAHIRGPVHKGRPQIFPFFDPYPSHVCNRLHFKYPSQNRTSANWEFDPPGYFLKNADVCIPETPPPLESANVCNWVPPPPLEIVDVLCGWPLHMNTLWYVQIHLDTF